MFLISVLSVNEEGIYFNLRKEIKETISRIFYGRFNTSCPIGKVVVECISNVFRVSKAYVVFDNSGWECRYRIFQRNYSFYTFQVLFK